MSTGVFGSVRPANVNINKDVEILYYYRPSRGENDSSFNGFKSLKAEDCLTNTYTEENNKIEGMFNLKLPLNVFNKKGFYTIYIKPKECKCTISDVSVLASYPDTKGIIFNITSTELLGLTDLTGYRVEFSDGTTRLIKTCNFCEPGLISTGDGYPKSVRYNLTDSGSYVFCTVSPSSAPSFRTNAYPYIGEPGVEVKVINTKFTPKMIELEMVEHDIETVSTMLEGDQINDRDNAIITTYNSDHEIYHQSDYYVLKDKLGNPLFNVKKKRENIDHTQDYNNIVE